MTERTRDNLWGDGLTLALIALALFAAQARGQTKLPGVGYRPAPGTLACWACGPPEARVRCHRMNLEAHPWKNFGSREQIAAERQLKADRYCAGSLECVNLGYCPWGMYAEDQEFNEIALRNACLHSASFLAPGAWDCNPTREETFDFQFTTSRLNSRYEQWYWQFQPGGSPENPLVVAAPSWVFYEAAVRRAGVCEAGVTFSEPARFGWRTHYRVDWLPPERPWCQATPAPQPQPGPAPPPPTPEPECEPLAESRFLRSCQAKSLELEPCRELAGRNPNSTLAALMSRVCPEDPDPPAPIETCLQCSWDAGQQLFRPGAPSTGKLTIELVCRGVECPGEGP